MVKAGTSLIRASTPPAVISHKVPSGFTIRTFKVCAGSEGAVTGAGIFSSSVPTNVVLLYAPELSWYSKVAPALMFLSFTNRVPSPPWHLGGST